MKKLPYSIDLLGEKVILNDSDGDFIVNFGDKNLSTAMFIARACNAHEDLISALFRTLYYAEECQRDPAYTPDRLTKTINAAKDALKKAGIS